MRKNNQRRGHGGPSGGNNGGGSGHGGGVTRPFVIVTLPGGQNVAVGPRFFGPNFIKPGVVAFLDGVGKETQIVLGHGARISVTDVKVENDPAGRKADSETLRVKRTTLLMDNEGSGWIDGEALSSWNGRGKHFSAITLVCLGIEKAGVWYPKSDANILWGEAGNHKLKPADLPELCDMLPLAEPFHHKVAGGPPDRKLYSKVMLWLPGGPDCYAVLFPSERPGGMHGLEWGSATRFDPTRHHDEVFFFEKEGARVKCVKRDANQIIFRLLGPDMVWCKDDGSPWLEGDKPCDCVVFKVKEGIPDTDGGETFRNFNALVHSTSEKPRKERKEEGPGSTNPTAVRQPDANAGTNAAGTGERVGGDGTGEKEKKDDKPASRRSRRGRKEEKKDGPPAGSVNPDATGDSTGEGNPAT